MANIDILKRVMKTQTTDVMHTSAYANSQNGGNFGAASTESFSQRRSIEEQRKFVRGYNNSRLMATGATVPRAKAYTPPPPKPITPATPPKR